MQVYGYCMFKDGEQAKVGYPTEGFDGDVAGRSFHNGRFVQRLREAAAGVSSITLRQGIAKRLLNGEACTENTSTYTPLMVVRSCPRQNCKTPHSLTTDTAPYGATGQPSGP